MADDEEVVFENSPLYTYLKQSGFTDADVCPEPTVNSHKEKHYGDVTRNWLTKVSSFIHNTFTRRISSKENSTINVEQKFAAELLKQVSVSSALVEEDAVTLQNLLADCVHKDLSVMDILSSTSGAKLLSVGIVCGLASLLLNQIWSLILSVASFTTISVVSSTLHAAKLKKCWHEFDDFLSDAERFCKVTKKAVRLVQEKELMSRGFTTVDNLSAVFRLERANLQISQRLCPELRRVTFEADRNVMLICRSATAKLLKKHIMDNALLRATSFLSTSALEDYGPCVTLRAGCDELERATDNYSVTAIKAMVQLCRIHLSELLRVIVFTHLMPQQSDELCAMDFRELSTELQSRHRELQPSLQSLTQCYALHDCMFLVPRREDAGKMEWQPTASRTHTAAVYSTVHSLRLHLQAALGRIHDLEKKLEPLCEVSDPMTFELKQEITSELKVIKGNMAACDDCWDTINQLNEAGTNDTSLQPPIDLPGEMSSAESKDTISLAAMTEPTLQDQVFEVYTNPDSMSPISNECSEDVSNDDQEKQVREKREAKRVLGELKRVIAVRSVERDRMLNRATTDGLLTSDGTTMMMANSVPPQIDANSRLSFGLFGTINMNACGDMKMTKISADSCGNFDEDDGLDSSDNSETHDCDLDNVQLEMAGDKKYNQSELFVPNVYGASIAAMAVARSRQMAALSGVDTFGDDSSSGDNDDEIG